MSLRTFLFPLLTTSLLVLGACGGGGGGGDDSGNNGDGGGDGGGTDTGQTSKQIRTSAFGTGVWTQSNSSPDSGVNVDQTYLVYNDGESVRITNCSLRDAFDEALTWTSDSTIVNAAEDVSVTVTSDNSIKFVRDGLDHKLKPIANPATIEISAPSTLVTDGSNPACGFANGPVDGGTQRMSLMTLVGNQIYLIGANFTNGYQAGGVYDGNTESSVVTASADLVDSDFLAELNANTLTSTDATGTSVEITGCSESSVSGKIVGMSTTELGEITGDFDLSVVSGETISCAEYSEAPPEDNPEEATLPNISEYYDAPVCGETGESGSMTGLWKIDELTVNAAKAFLAQFSINEDTLDDLLGDFIDSVFLVTETGANASIGEGLTSEMGFAICQATTANEPFVEARFIELDRNGEDLGVSSDNAGDLDADFFNIIKIKNENSMVIDLSSVSLTDVELKRRSAKLGEYCIKSETDDGVFTTTSADMGCTGFFNKDADNLLAVNAEINGRLALVYAEFDGPISVGNYALGAGVLKNVWIKYKDITNTEDSAKGELIKVHNAHFWIDKIDSANWFVSIPKTNGHFILQLEDQDVEDQANANYVHGYYKSWRWR